jgi:hypothetical protein
MYGFCCEFNFIDLPLSAPFLWVLVGSTPPIMPLQGHFLYIFASPLG